MSIIKFAEEPILKYRNQAEGVKDRAGSWEIGQEYCKPTAIKATTEWAVRNWCTWDVGGIRGASLWTQ